MKKEFFIILLYILCFAFLTEGCSTIDRGKDPKEAFVSSLLKKMTLEEKIGQMTLFTSGWDVTGPVLNENYKQDILAGNCGNIFNAHTVSYNLALQKMAVEETRLGIPLLFGYDVIHGYKTIFPIPLAEACSWDLDLINKSAALAAKEAAAGGVNWTFAPMVDLTRDPRWGRVSEGAGEDSYLGSLIAAARVKGFQGDSLSDPFSLAACVKHFAAYGAPEGGRDYATVDVSERTLSDYYLKPYQSAVEAGVATLMTSFNEINGVPASGNSYILKDILRNEWGFKGMVVTDYTSINEMVLHGYSTNLKEAGEQAVAAGVDMDMQGSVFLNHLKESVDEGKIALSQIDEAVRRVLNLKYDLGLFDNPYRYLDENREKEVGLSAEMTDHALEAAHKSIVLLKNDVWKDSKLLPIDQKTRKIAIIGPLGDNQIDLLGSWHAAGDVTKVVSLLESLKKSLPNVQISYSEACTTSGNDGSKFPAAIKLAWESDLVIMAIGENYQQNGEAASRSDLNLPGVQQELLEKVVATGKPVVVVLMAGRPLTITWMAEHIPAILNTWHLGTCTGEAIADVLLGRENPSGKLVMSFPRNTGQIPVYYNMKNTGRPFDPDNKYTSKYLDVPNTPLFPFGYGLSYTEFNYTNLRLSTNEIGMKDSLRVSVELSNTGSVAGEEVVQLYIQDLVGSVTRPSKELKGFKKLLLQAGESKVVSFSLTSDQLRFYGANMKFAAEPGEFKVYVGTNSVDNIAAGFTLK